MPRSFVDLSIFLENDARSDPPAFAPGIEHFTHENTCAQIEPFFPGLKKDDLPDGEGWAVERVQLSTHHGTHLDAPHHFRSTMNPALGDKERAIAIDKLPLEWCFQPGATLDFRHLADGYGVTAADVAAKAARTGHTITPLEIVVVDTRTGSRCGSPDPVSCGCGMDYHVPAGAQRAPDRQRRLELARALRPHRENVRRNPWRRADLGRPHGRPRHRPLPSGEAAQARNPAGQRLRHLLLPAQLCGASAGWTRAVAIFDDKLTAA